MGFVSPQPDTDSTDPLPDPSVLQDPADPQLDSFMFQSTAQDPADLEPGPSVLKTAALQDPADPQLGLFQLVVSHLVKSMFLYMHHMSKTSFQI